MTTPSRVLDDDSPDGTGEIADDLAARHPGRVRVMHRTGARGLGRSYLAGFRDAVASDADAERVAELGAGLRKTGCHPGPFGWSGRHDHVDRQGEHRSETEGEDDRPGHDDREAALRPVCPDVLG